MSNSKTVIVYFHIIGIYFLIIGANTTKRHINCTLHSEDDADKISLNLVHATAVGDVDTVHYLYSSYKVPSAIVARTTSDAYLMINFEKLRSMEDGALRFSEEPLAMTGLTISELFEKSYSSDTASIDQTSSEVALGLEFFQWHNVTNATFSCSDLSAFLHLESSSSKEDLQVSDSGIFRMQFSVSGVEEDASDFPHLVYTGNSTQLKVAFDDFHTSLNSSRTRYGLEMLVFNKQLENCTDVECKGIVVDSISDEFSPGIFSDVNVKFPCSRKDNEKGSFLSWRPVAYISPEATVANSSDVYMSKNCPQASNGTARSIAELFFNDQARVSANVFNLTFGTVGGGFYSKTQYSAWSLMLGTGTSVSSKLSVAAIIFLIIGVGGIGLSLLGGAIFLIVRKFRRNDDDLLLDENSIN